LSAIGAACCFFLFCARTRFAGFCDRVLVDVKFKVWEVVGVFNFVEEVLGGGERFEVVDAGRGHVGGATVFVAGVALGGEKVVEEGGGLGSDEMFVDV
jgi:hypothetical protein